MSAPSDFGSRDLNQERAADWDTLQKRLYGLRGMAETLQRRNDQLTTENERLRLSEREAFLRLALCLLHFGPFQIAESVLRNPPDLRLHATRDPVTGEEHFKVTKAPR